MEVLMSSTLFPSLDRHVTKARLASILLGVLIIWVPASPARAEGATPPSKRVDSWRDAERTTPEELAQLLRSPAAEKPAIFNVGFRVLFAQAHIPGSELAGPGKDQTGLDALRKAVSALPKSKPIVLYCGCCPWERCPNLEKPWRQLVTAGFTHVKVLYIPKSFGQDWVQKGYPVEASDPDRG
jgi:thiosulfate/3-mercaptopyruvate sulfurtransferase